MRRLTAALAVVVAVAALAGCAALPPGVDGALTNNWPAMPEAKITVPLAGVCYLEYDSGDRDRIAFGYRLEHGDDGLDCAQTHYVETAFVGAFTGADAARTAPPEADSPALPGFYDQCQKAASDYLGGDWHTAYVSLALVLPTIAAWRGGARWFRCDLTRYTNVNRTDVVDHGVLKGDLSGARAAAYGCLSRLVDKATHMLITTAPTDCAAPHQAEFAGVYTAPDVPYPSDEKARYKMLGVGCAGVVANFLGFSSVSEWQNSSVGWWTQGWSSNQWKLGDRTTQCFAYAFTKSGNFVGSVQGIRNQTAKG